MKKQYIFDVTTEAVVKGVVAVEADDFESAEMLRDQEIDSGNVLWRYEGLVESAGVSSTLRS